MPDVYGVFKYVLEYKRAGYSYINLSQQVGPLGARGRSCCVPGLLLHAGMGEGFACFCRKVRDEAP